MNAEGRKKDDVSWTLDKRTELGVHDHAKRKYAALVLGLAIWEDDLSEDPRSHQIARDILDRVRRARPLSNRCVSLMLRRPGRRAMNIQSHDEFVRLETEPLEAEEGSWGVYLYDGALVYVLERIGQDSLLVKTLFFPYEEIWEQLNAYVAEETGVMHQRGQSTEQSEISAVVQDSSRNEVTACSTDCWDDSPEIDVSDLAVRKYASLVWHQDCDKNHLFSERERSIIVNTIRQCIGFSKALSNRCVLLLLEARVCGRRVDIERVRDRLEAYPLEIAEWPWGLFRYDGEIISLLVRAEPQRLWVSNLCFPNASIRDRLNAYFAEEVEDGPCSDEPVSSRVRNTFGDVESESPGREPLLGNGTG
jgi:hypothetical protein